MEYDISTTTFNSFIERISRFYLDHRIKYVDKRNFLILGLGGVGSTLAYILSHSCRGCIISMIDEDVIEMKNLGRGMFPYDPSIVGMKKFDYLMKIVSPLNLYTDYPSIYVVYDIVFDCRDKLTEPSELIGIDYKSYVKIGIDGRKVSFIKAKNYEEITQKVWGDLGTEQYSQIHIPTIFYGVSNVLRKVLR